MQDKVFGEIMYNNGWQRIVDCKFWNLDQLRIVVSAYSYEEPNDAQRDSYSRFIEDCDQISRMSYRKMKEYMVIIEDDILPYCNLEALPEDICELVSVSNILFLESGNFAIVCDSKWDDHGVAILCTETEMTAGPQDIIWMNE